MAVLFKGWHMAVELGNLVWPKQPPNRELSKFARRQRGVSPSLGSADAASSDLFYAAQTLPHRHRDMTRAEMYPPEKDGQVFQGLELVSHLSQRHSI